MVSVLAKPRKDISQIQGHRLADADESLDSLDNAGRHRMVWNHVPSSVAVTTDHCPRRLGSFRCFAYRIVRNAYGGPNDTSVMSDNRLNCHGDRPGSGC